MTAARAHALQLLTYAGVAVAGLVVAWLLMPYPENGCPAIYPSDCQTPSVRQQYWLAGVSTVLVIAALAVDRRRGRRSRTSLAVAALLGASLVVVGNELLVWIGNSNY